MAFVIAEPCIGVKDTACVEVCPVDCIHAMADSPQFYIDPATCIDCAACEPVCPVKAIFPGDQVPEKYMSFTAVNANFFKAFDKTKSAAYTRTKKGEAKEGDFPGTPSAGSTTAPGTPVAVEWKEVADWQTEWNKHEDDFHDRTEIQKRYGRVRSVFEEPGQYTVRVYLPEETPNHPFRYRYGYPSEMCTYDVQAEQIGKTVYIRGSVADPMFRKLCGHANSFPDSFYVEYTFEKPVESVSVTPKGAHVVDVVVRTASKAARAA